MILKYQVRGPRLLGAGCVIESVIGRRHKLIARGKDFVWNQTRFPDGVADRIAVPVIIWDSHIAQVIKFFCGVVLMNVGCYAINCA
jgi:hypothetical protein